MIRSKRASRIASEQISCTPARSAPQLVIEDVLLGNFERLFERSTW